MPVRGFRSHTIRKKLIRMCRIASGSALILAGSAFILCKTLRDYEAVPNWGKAS